jgi:hypothetical protein
MLKKVALVLVLVGCTLATTSTASAETYSQAAYRELFMAYEFAYSGYDVGDAADWYAAYLYAEEGAYYAYVDYFYTGDYYAYWAWQYAERGATWAYYVYAWGDPWDETWALDDLYFAYDYAYMRLYGE